MNQSESGFIGTPETDGNIGSQMRDIEVIRVSKTSVIARGRRYGRQWFLKGLREGLRDSAVMQRQLQKEFEIHSRLRHPSVPQLVGLENIDGLGLCIVEEWIEGVTLHEALQQKKIGSSERRRIMRALAETVAYLHSRGIVHRDLKPTNVMIRDISREVVLIDYGLADTADYVEIKGPAGTPGFISPEQERSGGADPSDDVYSLGVMMRLTSGHNSLGKRCTGPVKSRPKDAGALLKLIDSRAKRPRIIMSIVATLLIITVSIFGINRIRTLENSSRESAERVGQLSYENARNAALVSSLEDSLTNVTDNLLSAKEELDKLKKYENLKQSLIKNGCRAIDNIYERMEKNILADIATLDNIEIGNKFAQLVDECEKFTNDYTASLYGSGLTPEDIEIVNTTVRNHNIYLYPKYHKKWMEKRASVQEKKN